MILVLVLYRQLQTDIYDWKTHSSDNNTIERFKVEMTFVFYWFLHLDCSDLLTFLRWLVSLFCWPYCLC